jgi:type VI secretion system protein ImpM
MSPSVGLKVAAAPPGLFGKLPGHGDFLRRDLPDGFVQAFDSWLRESLATARERLGEAWLRYYLVAPAWRFALAEGICGPDAMAGVMIPSVDRVGRYFPFTLAAPVPPGTSPIAVQTGAEDWMARLESAAIAALDDTAPLDPLLARLAEIGPAPQEPGTAPGPVRLALEGDGAQARLASLVATRFAQPLALFWTVAGSGAVPPSVIVARSLPAPAAFPALLDGRFALRGLAELVP